MTSPRLSAVLIVKNEEEKLRECLESLGVLGSTLAGVFVYDTGSDDRSVEIARSCGAHVVQGYWDNDFARARNTALVPAETDWILSIDADERLTANVRILEKILADDALDAVKVALIDVREGEELQAHLATRLFRRSRSAWTGRVHEQVEAPDGSVLRAADPGRRVISLLHTGYDAGSRLQNKRERNAALAAQEIAEAEAAGDVDSVRLVRALVDHARTIMELGDREQAVTQLQRVRTMRADPLYRNFGLEILAECLADLDRLDEAEGVVKELRKGGLTPPSYASWLRLKILMRRGEFSEALAGLRRIDVLANCMGVVGKAHILLNARFICALAVRSYLEAAACLIQLTARHGKFEPGRVELMLKLAHEIPARDLADMLVAADGGFLRQVEVELGQLGPFGLAVAEAISAQTRTGRAFGIEAS